MEAKTFEKVAAQGDLMLIRIDEIPEGVTEEKPQQGKHVLAHSETGHHHAIEAQMGIKVFRTSDPTLSYLQVDGDSVDLIHHKSFDTHAPIRIRPGKYELRRQQEITPEGWQMVMD